MPDTFINNDVSKFILNVLIPAIIGISLKIAIMIRKNKLPLICIILSFVTGICSVLIFRDFVTNEANVPADYQPICIAIIAISGDKIGEFLVYSLKIDTFLESIIGLVKQLILNILKH